MTVIHELAPGVSLVERSTILLIGSVAAAGALSLPVNTLWMGSQWKAGGQMVLSTCANSESFF